jgi:hypothetical protein
MHPIKMTVNQIEPVRMSRYELKQGGKGRLLGVAAPPSVVVAPPCEPSPILSLRLIA